MNKQISQVSWRHRLGALHNTTLKIARHCPGFHLPVWVHQAFLHFGRNQVDVKKLNFWHERSLQLSWQAWCVLAQSEILDLDQEDENSHSAVNSLSLCVFGGITYFLWLYIFFYRWKGCEKINVIFWSNGAFPANSLDFLTENISCYDTRICGFVKSRK